MRHASDYSPSTGLPAVVAPLSARRVLATRNTDEAYSTIARRLTRHDMRFTGALRELDAQMNCLPLPGVSLIYLQYGADVAIDVGPFDDFFLVHMNIGGRCGVRSGEQECSADTGRAVVCSPYRALRFGWSSDSRVLAVKIDRAALALRYQALAGLPIRHDIDFDGTIDLGGAVGERWQALLRFVIEDANSPCGLSSTPGGAQQLADLVMTTLLQMQPGTHHALVNRPVSPAAPHYVKRAEEYMRAHLDRALTLDEIAAQTGVSARSLSNGFRDFRGVSPIAYSTGLRLERAHASLLDPDPSATVTTVAHQWGFQHLSNFSGLYRRRYGLRPCETLRRNRA